MAEMVKKLTKFGNSQALVIDKAVLDLLGIDASSKMRITTNGHDIILSPIKENAGGSLQESTLRPNNKDTDAGDILKRLGQQ